MQHHKYSLTELENMIPWEKDIYVNMLIRYLEEENEKVKAANQQRRQEMAKTAAAWALIFFFAIR